MGNYTLARLKDEYHTDWSEMKITREAEIKAAAQKVLHGKPLYKTLEETTKVPWYFIGILHLREADCNFNCHLHNGDSLKARTHHVPAGRPRLGTPPFKFEDSAIDALQLEGFLNQDDWSIEAMAYRFEKYNGWGYRSHNTPSAYLWSGTSEYHSGKFVADGVFDSHTVDVQPGAMAVLKEIMILESITPEPPKPPGVPASSTVPLSPSADPPRPTNQQMNKVSRKHWWTDMLQGLMSVLGLGTASVKTLDIAQVQQTKSALDFVKGFAIEYGVWFVLAVIVALIFFCAYQKKLMKDDVQEGRAAPSGGDITPETVPETAVQGGQ